MAHFMNDSRDSSDATRNMALLVDAATIQAVENQRVHSNILAVGSR